MSLGSIKVLILKGNYLFQTSASSNEIVSGPIRLLLLVAIKNLEIFIAIKYLKRNLKRIFRDISKS